MNEIELTWKEFLIAISVFIAIVVGIKVGWAEIIHHDWRCAFTDCRIITR